MDLNNILSQLGLGGSKDAVCLSITPGIGIEAIQIDISARTVKNYACRPLEYNESLREIPDLNAFKSAVTELFEELKLNIKSNIILNIPMVLIGNKELPLLLDDNSVTQALTSEVEQSYIFKRYEPVVSWVDVNTNSSGESRNLFYSAIQKNVLDDIKNALSELGANLIKINISIISELKALEFTGLAEEQIREGTSWNCMVITQTGYSICSMLGNKLVDYYEEPLAIKSFEDEELYNAINASAQIALMSLPANCLYIISNTNAVSAEILAKKIQIDCPIHYIENNQFKKQDFLPVSLEILEETSRNISLEAIGIAVDFHVKLPVDFNFLGGNQSINTGDNPNELIHVVLGSYEFDISPMMAQKYAIIIAIILIVPTLLLSIFLPITARKKQSQLDEINSKLQTVQAEIKKIEDEEKKFNDFDVNSEIKKVLGENRTKLMSYTALGESVPKNLWLTYFVARDDGKIDIKGNTSNVEDVYTFYKNMKDSLINTQLRIYKLELTSSSIDDQVSVDPSQPSNYQFEITNMSEEELKPKDQEDNGSEDGKADNKEDKKGQLLNKPLLDSGKDKK